VKRALTKGTGGGEGVAVMRGKPSEDLPSIPKKHSQWTRGNLPPLKKFSMPYPNLEERMHHRAYKWKRKLAKKVHWGTLVVRAKTGRICKGPPNGEGRGGDPNGSGGRKGAVNEGEGGVLRKEKTPTS